MYQSAPRNDFYLARNDPRKRLGLLFAELLGRNDG